MTGDIQRPKGLSTPTPTYPDTARADKAQGLVIMDCVIDEQGRVTQADIIQSSGREDFDKSARDTVRTWSFQPATLKGKPLAVTYTLTVNFQLDEKDKN